MKNHRIPHHFTTVKAKLDSIRVFIVAIETAIYGEYASRIQINLSRTKFTVLQH